jgi:AraC-like DNA-binding protein
LDVFIDTLWTSARTEGLPHPREWSLPSGCADLVIPLDRPGLCRYDGAADPKGRTLAGGLLQGPQQRATLRDTSGASIVVGAHFKPAGLVGLWAEPAHAFAGLTLPLDEIWPGFADRLRERILGGGVLDDPGGRLVCFEAALRRRLRVAVAPDPMVSWAWPRLARGATVGDVQRASGYAAATFIARYRGACGLAPKRHAALMRFHALLGEARAPRSWAVIAADAGYADQAHLTREFSRLAGLTPGQYRRDATEFASHVACR